MDAPAFVLARSQVFFFHDDFIVGVIRLLKGGSTAFSKTGCKPILEKVIDP